MALSRREFLISLGGFAALFSTHDAWATASFPTGTYGLAGTVLSGDGSPPKSDHVVLISNGKIEAVTPTTNISDRKIFAFPGATILPGIINCHVHRIHTPADRRERYLKHGVTAIGDAASPMNTLNTLTHSPPGKTATAACAGPMLCPPGGYPLPVHSSDHALIVSSAHEGRERVRQLADAGATMVKLSFEPGIYPEPWPMFDAKTANAICNEARKRNMIVRCHVEDFEGLQPALNAGVHTVEHVPHRWIARGKRHSVLQKEGNELLPIPKYQKLLERMVGEKIILTPTLDVLTRSIWNGPELYKPVLTFQNLGGRIAVGNDHPYRRTDAGMPIQEMRLLHKAGLNTSAILQGATQTSANACGFTDKGALAQGMAADILVVSGDPLTNLETLTTPIQIIKDGEFVKTTG